jgi:hypothetical protein
MCTQLAAGPLFLVVFLRPKTEIRLEEKNEDEQKILEQAALPRYTESIADLICWWAADEGVGSR